MINLDEFDGSKVKVGKKDFHDVDIYYLGYEYKKKITECDEINSLNHLYLRIKDMKGYFEKDKMNNEWYLTIIGDVDVLKRYASVFKSIRAEIEEITGGIITFDKDYKKIRFESENDLPEDSIIDLHLVTIVIRSIFSQNGKFYPQLCLDDALYEL